jgi:hypothetical protein
MQGGLAKTWEEHIDMLYKSMTCAMGGRRRRDGAERKANTAPQSELENPKFPVISKKPFKPGFNGIEIFEKSISARNNAQVLGRIFFS